MNLDQLRAFVAVAQTGGFASAAGALGVAPSTLTRAVANLEASLDARLFHRTTRSVSLTEAGETFLTRVLPALDELDAAADLTSGGASALTGTLRVSASVSFGQAVLAPNLAQFCKEHPGLAVDLNLSDNTVDLVAERIDVAIRHGDLHDSSLVAQRLAPVTYYLVASPDYVRRHRDILHPEDIPAHTCLTFPYAAFRSRWRFQRGETVHHVEIAPKVRISNAAALATCARSGLGLALLADWTVAPDLAAGSLVRLLPGWMAGGSGTEGDAAISIIMPSRAFVPAKTRAFIEFLRTLAGTALS
ncbi:MAG: LysR substrate-binding domain-containing protein [Pseudomonadota bacterium]